MPQLLQESCLSGNNVLTQTSSPPIAHQSGKKGFSFAGALRLAVAFVIVSVRLVSGRVVIILAAALILIAWF